MTRRNIKNSVNGPAECVAKIAKHAAGDWNNVQAYTLYTISHDNIYALIHTL